MKALDNLLLSKLLLHIPADYSWTDAGIVRIGAVRGIATFSIFLGRSMFRCWLTSFGRRSEATSACPAWLGRFLTAVRGIW